MTALDDMVAEHQAALRDWRDADDTAWNVNGDALNSRLTSAIDAILDHRPQSLDEVRAKASFMANDATFSEWDGLDVKRILQSLIPAQTGDA